MQTIGKDIMGASGMQQRYKVSSLEATPFRQQELPPEIEISASQMKNDRELRFLLDKIKRNRNVDFNQYRIKVLERRIQHRLHLTGCATYLDYVMLLNKDPKEYDRLIECLTIKVSEFFRDPSVFELLGNVVIPEVISLKRAQGIKKIRAWSCGAAFGQEAHSMAILFCEVLGSNLNGFDIRILATDIDKDALEKAPWGSYDRTSLHKISPHLLFKYFTRIGDRYILSDKARALVSFQYHDIISGNTMPSMDLVLCRNLLIYFQKENQATILKKLHEVLMSSGFLVLGKTETLPLQMFDCFDVVDLRERIYRKKLPIKQKREGRKMAEICATDV